MTNTLRLGTLFLAEAAAWTHRDGTAPVRVHAALTAPDAAGCFWAARGTTQWHAPTTSVKVEPNATSRLLRTTWFSALSDAVVQLNVNDIKRVTGSLTANEFNALWDRVESA